MAVINPFLLAILLSTITLNVAFSYVKPLNTIEKINVDEDTSIIAQTLQFLENGRKELNYSDSGENIFILGTTGTGKSTLALTLTGDNSKLISVDTGESEGLVTGEYYIADETGLIGAQTVVSNTILPHLFHDDDFDKSFYDCPGYDDTRNASVDMTSSFFIKDVLNASTSVRLVFVVDYDSVRPTGSRTGFPSLVEHINRFMKDFDKYVDAVGMVATKYDKPKINDDSAISNIAVFLKNTRAVFAEDINEKPFHRLGIKFIDSLLRQNKDGKYDRMSISRSPDEPGPISEIEIMQKSRNAILHMIYNVTTFIPINEQDFGYTISLDSQIEVYGISKALNNDIRDTMKSINDKLINKYKMFADEKQSLTELEHKFDEPHKRISDCIDELEKTQEIQQFMNIVIPIIKNFELPKDMVDDIENKIKFFNFLQLVSNNATTANTIVWANSLRGSLAYLRNLNGFYKFLSKINELFSKNDYQSDRSRYNVSNINDWGELSKPQGLFITNDNWSQFAEKIGYLDIKDSVLNNLQLEQLNDVLFWTITSPVNVQCSSDGKRLTVSGEYVKIGDIKSAKCFSSAKYINVFAINNVIFNDKFDGFDKQKHLSIIGRKWDIITDRKITLNGSDGAQDLSALPDSEYENIPGAKGKAGGHGTNSDHFLGIAEQFSGGDLLTIEVNGGNGGSGQNGARGRQIMEELSPIYRIENGVDCGRRVSRFKHWTGEPSHEIISLGKLYICVLVNNTYKLYGECGSSGGDGGANGKRGNVGTLNILELSSKSGIKKSNIAGKDGAVCGFGGKVGKNADVLYVTCQSKSEMYCPTICSKSDTNNFFETGRDSSVPEGCLAVNSGSDCNNKDNQGKTPFIDPFDQQTPKREFIALIKSNMDNILRKDMLQKFLTLFEQKT